MIADRFNRPGDPAINDAMANPSTTGLSTSATWTRIHGGTVLGRGNRDADLYLCGDRVADPPPPGTAIDHTIDAAGHHVMAGGIDLHTHIGGGKLTIARMMMQSQMGDRPHHDPILPTGSVAASRYLDIGYTTCFEPAVIPINARSAHMEMAGCHGLDTGGYCLLGNEPPLLAMIADGIDRRVIAAYVAAMVAATGSIAVKVVNAGGIDAFKFNRRTLDVNDTHPVYDVTPAQVIRTLARAVADIGLRHPLHVHCSNLGVPGNIDSTLATIAAADGLPIHLTHVQFHSYAKTDAGMSTAAARIAAALNDNPNVTIDVGQVVFGQTVTMSADAMHQFDGVRHGSPPIGVIADVASGGGCGVVPFRYRNRRFVGALQFAIGLELFLMVEDPSRVFLTTDHPNGGPFTAYPHLMRLLADKTFRDDVLATIHPDALAACELSGLDRQYTIDELHTMTRTGPADILGLHDRGRLRPGDIADVVLIPDDGDMETRFATPTAVIRRGQLIRQNGSPVSPPANHPAPPHQILAADRDRLAKLAVDADHNRVILDYQSKYGDDTFPHLWIDDDEFNGTMNSQLAIAGEAR